MSCSRDFGDGNFVGDFMLFPSGSGLDPSPSPLVVIGVGVFVSGSGGGGGSVGAAVGVGLVSAVVSVIGFGFTVVVMGLGIANPLLSDCVTLGWRSPIQSNVGIFPMVTHLVLWVGGKK